MIEAYVAIALFGIGYLINNKKPLVIPKATSSAPPPGDRPSTSNRVVEARATEFAAVKKGRVQETRSELSGASLDSKHFHNNMVPFIRGDVKQNMRPDLNSSRLESFGTIVGDMRPKKELDNMFKVEPNVSVFNPSHLDDFKQRQVVTQHQNNVLPFVQIKVGPGVGQGFSAQSVGGYQQLETQQYVMPKSVDDLRVANNPKTVYEGRTIDGIKEKKRAEPVAMDRNRVPTTFEKSPNSLFKTTGAYTRPAQIPNPEDKYTARRDTSVAYTGIGGYVGAKGAEQRPDVRSTSRPVLSALDTGVATATNRATNDYGKASIQVYTNERDLTTTRTVKSNLTTVVKAVVAPVIDVIRTARKEFLVEAPRPNGMLQAQIPTKLTVRDPNNVAPTTLKETLIHDSDTLNFRGATKITVYDPNDVARTTIKETNIHDADNLNVRGPRKITVYDPNAIMRTTLKETLIHDADTLNVRSLETRGQVYANEDARSTIRQTTDPAETTLNMARVALKSQAHDPNDITRTTIKQTTLDESPLGLATQKGTGAYVDENFDAKTTQKETFVDNDYFGGAEMGSGEAYQIANFDAKDTQKQNPSEYFGSAASADAAKAPMSYQDIYAATMNGLRESTLVVDHEPTNSGVKVASGLEDRGDFTFSRVELPQITNDPDLIQRSPNIVQVPKDVSITHTRQDVRNDDRLDLEILEPFKRNPYTQSLSSVGPR